MTLRQRLLERISRGGFIAGGTLEMYAHDLGYKPSTAGRRLRELAREGVLIKNYQGGYVQYAIATGFTRTPIEPRNSVRYEVLPKEKSKPRVDTRAVQLCFELVKRESPNL